MGEHASRGKKQRVNACRKRLRRTRVMRKTLKVEQDETALAADRTLAVVHEDADFSDSEDVFEEAEASTLGTASRFSPEVDRRARLRAR